MGDNKVSNNKPGDKELNIDSIIDKAELERLRQKYAAADSETAGIEDSESTAEEEAADEKQSASADARADEPQDNTNINPGVETKPDDEPNQSHQPRPRETQAYSDDNMEKLTSSFRIIYEDSLTKLDDFIPTVAEDPQPPAQTSAAGAESAALPDDKTLLPLMPESVADNGEESVSPPKSTFKRLLKKIFPSKGDGVGESIRKIILFSAIITMLVCGGILLNRYIITPYFRDLEAKKTAEMWSKSNDGNDDWSIIKAKYPDIVFPDGMLPKHADLYATNSDFVGWLEIPGIDISLPIVQGENNDVYLNTSFYGEKSIHGCCFMDSSNNIKKLDRNTIIHGHNMSHDDLMFGLLETYKKINGFKSAPLIKFDTLFRDTKWKIYAVFLTNGDGSADNGYLFPYLFRNVSSDQVFKTYIDQIDKRKIYTTGVDILPTDQILTLSTCTYEFNNARLVVVARLLRDGESENIDVSKAQASEDPLYPHYWYVATKQKNPYKNKELWYPS